jgi:hypothetical protein
MIHEWINNIDRGNRTRRKNQCHLVHRKSHMDWPGREPRILRTRAGDLPPELWHGLGTVIKLSNEIGHFKRTTQCEISRGQRNVRFQEDNATWDFKRTTQREISRGQSNVRFQEDIGTWDFKRTKEREISRGQSNVRFQEDKATWDFKRTKQREISRGQRNVRFHGDELCSRFSCWPHRAFYKWKFDGSSPLQHKLYKGVVVSRLQCQQPTIWTMRVSEVSLSWRLVRMLMEHTLRSYIQVDLFSGTGWVYSCY